LKRPAVKRYAGGTSARGRRFGIVVSRFNEYLTGQLLDCALDTLAKQGADPKNVHVVNVPGAFEVPLAAKKLIRLVKPDSVLTLSVVIRGKTRHFDQVILGMISADDPRDAAARAAAEKMNKGREWALSAIEMANLGKKLRKKRA
jgi:6,7-dimethyl-8-ribityllumazine synthase